MTLYDIKPAFQSLLRPLCDRMASSGISANQITLLAVAMCFLSAIILLVFSPSTTILYLLPIVLFLRMALNAIDGMLAKEHGMQTHLGAILNELGDIISDTLLYLPLVYFAAFNSYLVITFVILAITTEFMGILAQSIGGTRRYDGPIGKSDRALALGIICIILASGVTGAYWVNGCLLILCVGMGYTIYNRANSALKDAI